ncbi:MAG: type II toxin-antitoxin system VapC family toxin [Synergistaceae bacterium]|nr:type II toxin-antitoxin system VapC family toxin [Synergistaceae bacterium]
MKVVLDVSAAIEIILHKENRQAFEEVYLSAARVIAPDLFVAEITNVFWKIYRAGLMPEEECLAYAEDGVDMIDRFFDSAKLWKRALKLSIKHNHPSYDMLYLALAEKEKALLMTSDKALARLCGSVNIPCRSK